MNFDLIFNNNQKWIDEKLELNKDYFKELSKGQNPEILYLGCSDSRVTAEEIMGLEPGVAFIHRNIANIIPNTDLSSLSVINYAVNHLEVNHIVVCGHYYCGGVLAAMQSNDLGILNPWLGNIRDVYRIHLHELNAISNEEDRYKRLVELNVQEQCINVLKIFDVQNAYRTRGLKIHGWVFDIHTGRIINLKINFAKILRGISETYRIQ
jgi:carbonic anhydrase